MGSSRMLSLGLILVALLLLAASCGDSDEGGTTTAAPGVAADPATTGAPATTATPETTAPEPIQTAPVVITGEPLPVVADNGEDTAVGSAPPQVVGAGFGGNEVVLAGGNGPQAIMFVSHWCPHCQDEVPAVQTWVDETGGVEGVEIVAVSTAVVPERPNYPPSEWFAAEAWSSPVMVDDPEASSFIAFGGQVIPFWVFVDGAGKVFHRIEGGVDPATLEAVMNDLAQTG